MSWFSTGRGCFRSICRSPRRCRRTGDWRGLDFQMPAGVVVPLVLEGLSGQVEFDAAAPVVPSSAPAATGSGSEGWRGFLPADGHGALAWKPAREAAEGTLFFTGNEQTDVRVGAGLLTADLADRRCAYCRARCRACGSCWTGRAKS